MPLPTHKLDYRNADDETGRYHRALHVLAILTTLTTFPLIFMGGLVTSHQAGMSVPDWPNSYGYNMFLFPPNQWVGGIIYEHTHRLMGTVVGFCAVLLVMVAWGVGAREAVRTRLMRLLVGCIVLTAVCGLLARLLTAGPAARLMPHLAVGFASLALVFLGAGLSRRRNASCSLRWLSVAALLAVLFQGALGGLRVVWVKLDLAIVHACVAQAFFCFAALIAILSSRRWTEQPPTPVAPTYRPLAIWACIAVSLIYGQLIVGAVMRHYQAGLAIPDLVLPYGHWLPPTSASELEPINNQRAWTLNLDPVTLTQIWLNFGHRLGAILVTAAVGIVIARVLSQHRREIVLIVPAIGLLGLIIAQVTLGLLTVYYRKPADITSFHVAGGALVLLCAFVLAVWAVHLHARQRTHLAEDAAALKSRRAAGNGLAPLDGGEVAPAS